MQRWIAMLAVLLLATSCSLAHRKHDRPPRQPDLLQETSAVKPGGALNVPVRISGGPAVALQFDLEFDPQALELVGASTAPASAKAGKELTVRPVRQGVARVVVFGQNLDPLPEGSQGEVRFRAVREGQDLRFLAVRRATPDAEGRELPSTVRQGVLIIEGGV